VLGTPWWQPFSVQYGLCTSHLRDTALLRVWAQPFTLWSSPVGFIPCHVILGGWPCHF
jgi:hypothetical protein